MREQDIRQILKEVCDSIDRQRATAGSIAVGVAIAIGTAGCEKAPPPAAVYMGPPVSSTEASSASSVSDSAPATEAAASTDSGATAPPMVVKYGAPDPATSPTPPTSDTEHLMKPKYMVLFDAGPVARYGVRRPPPDDASSM
jgi:hypothetical protein